MAVLFTVTAELASGAQLPPPRRETMPCGHEGHACSWPGGVSYGFCAICDLDWECKGRGPWVSA